LLVVLIFLFFNGTSYFSVRKITAILFEVFKLIGHGTKILLLEEFVWPEDLGLANEEVASFELRVEDVVAQLLHTAGGHGDVIL
jgi:hypothetical protein